MIVRGGELMGQEPMVWPKPHMKHPLKPSQYIETAKATLQNTRPTAQLFYGTNSYIEILSPHMRKPRCRGCTCRTVTVARGSKGRCTRCEQPVSMERLDQGNFRISTHCNAGWLAFVDWGSVCRPCTKHNVLVKTLSL